MKRQSIHFIVLFLYSNYTVRYQIIASKENSPYHQKNFCFFLKPNSFLIDRISCQGAKNLASTRKKTKFRVVISLRMQVFPITTIRFKNPAKISRFVYSTHSPFHACADKCPLCLVGVLSCICGGLLVRHQSAPVNSKRLERYLGNHSMTRNG